MLPSFRLIAATFLCGFFVVFAGLRLAASLNDIHEGLPVMAAHAAPVSITPAADREARRGLSSVPVMYDLRFAVSTVAPTLVRVRADGSRSPGAAAFDPAARRRSTGKALSTRRRRPKQPRKQPSPKPRSRRSSRTRRSSRSAVVPDAPAEPPAPKAPAVAAIDSQASRTRPPRPAAEHRRRRDPGAASPRPRRTSRKPRPRPPSKSPPPDPDSRRCTGRDAGRSRNRIPSPSRVRPLPHSQPDAKRQAPSCQATGREIRRRRCPGQGRAQEACSHRPPRRADEPPGRHLRQFEPRLRHLPGIAQR